MSKYFYSGGKIAKKKRNGYSQLATNIKTHMRALRRTEKLEKELSELKDRFRCRKVEDVPHLIPVLAVVKGVKYPIRAMFIPQYSVEAGDYEGDADYSEEKDEYYYPEGWYEWNNYDEINWFVNAEVIKWMPIPESEG